MNLEPPILLAARLGNNSDAKAVQLRVEGGQPLTPAQYAEVARFFAQHMTALRNSLAGFLQLNEVLSDGSRMRIVSNSGMHTVTVRAAGVAKPLLGLVLRLFCIPADTTHQYGWIAPTVTGQNGTTAASGTRDNAGAVQKVKQDLKALPPTFKKGSVLRYMPVLLPTLKNVDFASNGFSAQNWEHREWVAPNFKTVVSSIEKIRVNDVIAGSGPGFDTLFACVYSYTPPGDAGPSGYLFAVSVSFNSTAITVSRAPLSSAPVPTWSTVATIDPTTLDAAAAYNTDTNDHTMRWWVKKVAVNKSRTVCSLWLQSPNAEGQSHTGTAWVGVVDVDMATGVITSTQAQGEVTRYIREAHSGGTMSYATRHITSGVRQIAFDYEGDTKVFTELHFDGELHLDYSQTSESSTSGTITTSSYSIDRAVTDTRTVTLVRGTFNQLIGWVDYGGGTNTTHEGLTNTTDSDHPGTATISGSSWTKDLDVTQHVGALDYYGGHRGDVLMVKDVALRNVYHGDGGTTMTSGAYVVTGIQYTASDGVEVHRKIYAKGADLLDNGSGTYSAFVLFTTDDSFFQTGLAGADVADDSNPTNAQAWGSASNIDLSLYVSCNYTNVEAPVEGAKGLCSLGTSGLSGHPAYVATNTGGSVPDPSPMNMRSLGDDFFILSVPKIAANGRPSTSVFQSYCTDPTVVDAFNVDPITGILKGIRIK